MKSLNHNASRSVEILTKEKEGEKSDDLSQFVIKPKPVIYGEEKLESPNSTGVKVEHDDDSYEFSMSKESMALNMKKQVYKMCIWKLILGGGVNHAYPEKEDERGWSRNASI